MKFLKSIGLHRCILLLVFVGHMSAFVTTPAYQVLSCSRQNYVKYAGTTANFQRDYCRKSLLYNSISNGIGVDLSSRVLEAVKIVWNFSRPHTIVGSGLSILSLFLFATPPKFWGTKTFFDGLVHAMVPSLLMNLYITGLNQVTDVDIDKVNKPYLPIASGELSKKDGIVIVMASLVGALFNAGKMYWPLQAAIIGSGLLGTAYSLPPFRLKRFPILAAFCILVVRGSLVNLGFYLQAKMVMGEIVNKQFSLGNFAQAIAAYPESVWVTSFFAVFGLVIAIMKDVPDVKGDTMFEIPSFSVKLGAKRMFRISWLLLVSLLSGSALSAAWAGVVGASLHLPGRLIGALALGSFAFDLRKRALKVEAENPEKVFEYYMHMWNIFYLCYGILPLFR